MELLTNPKPQGAEIPPLLFAGGRRKPTSCGMKRLAIGAILGGSYGNFYRDPFLQFSVYKPASSGFRI